MAQASELDIKVSRALGILKDAYDRRGEMIDQVIPLLTELAALENFLSGKEFEVMVLLREVAGLPEHPETICEYLERKPVGINGPFEMEGRRVLAYLKDIGPDIPF